MAKSTRRAVDPDVLPHPRPCWCQDCTRAYGAEYRRVNIDKWREYDRCPLPTCVECGALTCKPPPPRGESFGLDSSTFRCSSCELPKWQTDNGRNARRNAAKRRSDAVAAGERFDVFDLIDRDGDDCHLCGKPVRFDVPYWHPEYGTIDHLVPIADGGEHTMANCAVAHFGCNASRGTRGTVQLRMV